MVNNATLNNEYTDQLTLLNASPTLFTHQPLSSAARPNSYRNFVMGKAVGLYSRRFDETFFEDVCMIKVFPCFFFSISFRVIHCIYFSYLSFVAHS
jgi:hypothetical protein